MYERVLVITINSYYSKVPSTGTAVLLKSTVPTTAYKLQMYCAFFFFLHRCDFIADDVYISFNL